MKINIDFIVKGLLVSNKKRLQQKLVRLALSATCMHESFFRGSVLPLLTIYEEGSFDIGCGYYRIFTNGRLYSCSHLCSTATCLVPAASPYIKAPFIWSRVPETTRVTLASCLASA